MDELQTFDLTIACENFSRSVPAFRLTEDSPIAIHVAGDEWTLSLVATGQYILARMTRQQAVYALRKLSGMPWQEPYTNESREAHRLDSAFQIERENGEVEPWRLARHIARRLCVDPDFAFHAGSLTETFRLVVAIEAKRRGICHAAVADELRAAMRQQGSSDVDG